MKVIPRAPQTLEDVAMLELLADTACTGVASTQAEPTCHFTAYSQQVVVTQAAEQSQPRADSP